MKRRLEVHGSRDSMAARVDDGWPVRPPSLEADWIAEACTRSRREHRPVRTEEVRIR